MGTMTINPTVNQSNKPWTLTWKASGRYPIVADRIYSTLAQAQAYVDDKSATASAIPGLVISVVDDTIAKNNGVYYVESIANAKDDAGFPIADKGVLKKVGGAETETAKNYSAAVTLSQTLVTGQLIKVTESQTITTGEGEEQITNTYKAGFYIVETPGTISALDTSTGAADEIGALKARVDALEGNRVTVTDFNNYKSEVTGALNAKAGLDDFNTHNNNANIHVTSEDKTKWNNAEANAKTYTDGRETEIDKKWAAADATLKTDLEAYADQAETDAITAAKKYTDGVVGAYTDGDVLGTGLRKEIEDKVAEVKLYADQAETDAITAAKKYTDDRETEINKNWAAADATLDTKAQGYASTAKSEAIADAKDYTDTEIGKLDSAAQGYASTAKSEAIADAKDYTDEVVGNYTDGETSASGLRKEIEDKVAAVSAAAKTYSIATVTGDELTALGANVKEAYKLIDEKSVKTGDYIKIYKDSALQSVELDGQSLKFTYLLANGETSVVPVDVSAFLAESEFGDGLQVVNHIVSVKLADGSESFLSVDENGVKLSGVQTAIGTAKSEAIADAKDYTDAEIGKLDTKAQGYASTAKTDAIADAKTYTDAEIVKVNNTITANETANSAAHTGFDNRIKANEDAIAVINGDAEGSIKKAAEDAQSAAEAAFATALADYMTKTQTETAISTAKSEAISAAEAAFATALADYMTKTQTETAISTAKSEAIADANDYTDEREAAIKIAYEAYADEAEADANKYTDALFNSITIISTGDIDGMFEEKEEETI